MADKTPLYRRLYRSSVLDKAWDSLTKRDSSKGIDRVTIKEFGENYKHEKKVIQQKLKQKNYQFSPLKAVPLDKKTGKVFKGRASTEDQIRGIRVATVRDRVVQKAIVQVISEPIEKKYGISDIPVSFAYIKSTNDRKKGTYEALMKVHEYYKNGFKWAYKDDIISFFDTVDREKLINEFIQPVVKDEDLIKLIEKALGAEIANLDAIQKMGIEVNDVFPDVQEGIPQGSMLSPLFSNVFLKDFDTAFMQKKGVHLVRYADDFIIMCSTKEDALEARQQAKVIIEDELNLKLRDISSKTLSSEDGKTSISEYRHVEFLGIEFDGRKHLPAGKAFHKITEKLRVVPRTEKTFIEELLYLRRLSDSWGSTYWFTSFDKAKYNQINEELYRAVYRTLRRHGLRFSKQHHDIDRLGIPTFDRALSIHKNKRPR